MRNWPLLLAAAALMLGGCPRGEQPADQAQTTTPVPAAAAQTGTTASSTAAPSTPAVPGAAAGAAGGATATPGAAGQPGTAEESPAELAKLEGEWFALFGRHDIRVIEKAWQKEQRLRFDKHGQAVFSLDLGGGKTESVECTFTVSEDTLYLSLPGAQAVTSGLSKVAPLGISRNEEVGLLKQPGRNEEVGLLKSGKGAVGGTGLIKKEIRFVALDDFLVLTDQLTRIMIYGRYQPPAEAEPLPDVSGKWSASFAGEDLSALAKLTGTELVVEFSPLAKFSGHAVHGYFAGRIKDQQGLSLAALCPSGTDKLVGVYCRDPYAAMKSDLELSRP
jgi:hypothetical protein